MQTWPTPDINGYYPGFEPQGYNAQAVYDERMAIQARLAAEAKRMEDAAQLQIRYYANRDGPDSYWAKALAAIEANKPPVPEGGAAFGAP